MSLTQSRSEKNDSQYRKPGGGRSANTSGAQQRSFSGGRGRGAPGPTSHPAPLTSTTHSYKKVNNAQGGQSRVNPETVNTSDSNPARGARSVENGNHVQPALQGVPSTPTPAAIAKPADAPSQKTGRPLPRAPSSSTNSGSTLPSTPAKGDGAKGFPLQFGSISPGFMNGMQVPARTSSAPPNLDEQKHDQARRDASRAVPAVPLPFGPKQDLSKKDVPLIENPITQETKKGLQAKRDVPVTSSSPPTQAQNPFALPMTGISMPSPFHQPTASMQFGGPNPQIHSQGMPTSSLQVYLQMPLQMGNPSQVPHQVFVPGLQHPLMQTQGIMHQGQNVGYNPQLATQHPHHIGNSAINMSAQFNQQPSGKFGSPHKIVKITHPDTHEELRLDGREGAPSGSMSHHSAPAQHQPHLTYTANHSMGYYSNSYTTSSSFFPSPSSLPLASMQLNATTQGSRFDYPISQAQSNISFVNLSSNTFPAKSGVSKHGSVDPSSADHIRNVQSMVPQVPSSSIPVTIKAAGEKATSNNGLGKVKPPKLLNPTLESGARKKDVNAGLQSKSGVGRLNQSAPTPASTPAATSIPATSLTVLNTSPRDLASIPSYEDAISKVTDVTSISVGDSQVQPSKKVDVQYYKMLKDLDDSPKTAIPERSEAKMILTSSGLRDGVAEDIRLSPLVTDAAPGDVSAIEVSANSSHSSESCESLINEAAKQNGPLSCEEITRGSSISKDSGEQERLEVLSLGNSLKGSDATKGADQDHQVKPTEKAALAECAMEASQREKDSARCLTEGENILHKLHDVCDISVSNTSSELLDSPSFEDYDVKKSSISDNEVIPVSANTLEASAEHESETVDIPVPSSSSSSISGSSKASMESNKAKNRGKKKLKELLQKADALGTTADLYMAYKGPEEKKEIVVAPEHSTESKMEGSVDTNTEESTWENKDEQGKTELDDWENAADIPTPKLEFSGNDVHDEEGVTTKKYSRDFLLTFSERCTDLPEGFETTSDVADALLCVSLSTPRIGREYPSPRRVVDRPGGVSRRGNGVMDVDRWNKQPGSFSPAHDPRMDLAYGSNVLGSQGGRGPSFGVLRNPRPQGPVQHAGGILSGPIHSLGFQGSERNNSDADRWQRASNFNKGLMPSPHAPAPVIHKAERKYEVGKITDEEQAKQRKLKGILNKLTPQNFERLFEQVKEVNIDNVRTLTGVISQIFDKALTEPTFCEMYASFCQHLASELPDLSEDDEKITFRRLLLNKCQEEFERGEREEHEAYNVDGEGDTEQSKELIEEKRVKVRRRMLGNIRLIGELYKKRMLTERIMHECLKKLLGQYQNPDEENIEALCKLLSTIGEMIDHPKAKEHMDPYFDIMGQLSSNMQLSSRVRFMLRDAIDLRKNKWQQRRKVEGPKKIEEVHRDAAQERQGQVIRLNRGPSMNSASRRGQPLEYGPRGSMLSSPVGAGMVFRGMPSQVRGFDGQEMRVDEKNISMPLPQRLSSDDPITFGPQGGLARGMAHKGQPSVSNSSIFDSSSSFGDPRRMASGMNCYGTAVEDGVYSTRDDHFIRNATNRSGASAAYDQSSSQQLNSSYRNRELRFSDRNMESSLPTTPPVPRAGASVPQNNFSEKVPEERLRDMSLAAIKEYYSAKDEKEVALCIKDLNAPSFYSMVVTIWVSDSFERKDIERDLLAKLLVALTKPLDGTFSPSQLIKGFESVLTDLEDTVTDAPKAPEFLGQILAKVVLEKVLPLKDVGRLIQHGGEEPGRLLEVGLAAEVVGSLLEMIKSEKGESALKDILATCNLQLEDFRPPHSITCRKLEMFM